MIVYHKPHQKSIGNIAQIWEKIRSEVCAICELIFFERCDIMKILRAASVGAQPKKPPLAEWLIFLFRTPDQLTLFPGRPAVNALLVHDFANRQSVLLGGYALTNVYIVDAVAKPDADVAFATHALMQDFADLFWSLALDAGDTDLPSGLILNDLAVAKSQTFIISQIADGADIDAMISSVLHNSFSFLLEAFALPL